MNVYNKKMQGYKKLKKLLYFTKLYPIFQFQLNFPSMSFSSNFRMLISQQSSTTPVQPAELINTKMEVFFMRELRKHKNHCCRSRLRQHENSKYRHTNRNQSL